MKVQELLDMMNTTDVANKWYESVKRYISIVDKKKLAMQVLSACTDEIDGFVEVDRFKMDIYFDMCVLNAYAGLDISLDFDEMTKEYDALCESELMHWIKNWFAIDYEVARGVLDKELQTLLEQNSLDAQIVRLVNSTKKIIDALGEKLESVDLNNILPDGINVEQFEQVMKMIK